MAGKAGRVVLVDGTWLVFRAYFAIPANLTNSRGLHTNAIYGFATMFRKLFSGRRPEWGAVAFDPPGKTFREERYPEYRAQRPEMPPDLAEQLPWIDRLVKAHGFPMVRCPGWEADDVIGTLATEATRLGHEVVIVAGDKDFAQLVDDRVRLFDPMREVTYDPELVVKKWGVRPDQIVDLLAVMGDAVDNIPGIPGIGHKGAVSLLQKYGSVDAIYERLEELAPRQRTTLAENRDLAYLSRELATINRSAPIGQALGELPIADGDPRVLDALFRELDFFSLLTSKESPEEQADTNIEVIARAAGEADGLVAERLAARLDALAEGSIAVLALLDSDLGLGTGSALPAAGVLVGLAISDATGSTFHVPTAGDAALSPEALAPLFTWLEASNRAKVTHDVKGLGKALMRFGVEVAATDDTMLASFLIEPTKCVPHRLEQVSKEYLQEALPSIKSIAGGVKEGHLAEIPVAQAAGFAGRLAGAVQKLWPILKARLEDAGLWDHYRERELPLAKVLGSMELAGIRVDRADLATMSEEFEARKAAVEERIYGLAGHPFNIGSTQQLATVLFEELKLPVVKKTKTGYSTDAEVLEVLAKSHEIGRLLLEQRMLAKLINTYTEVLRQAVHPASGRVHATFQQTTGVSGRLISTDPDLQRTPIRTPEGRRIRRAFVADPGFLLLSADWSQIELRVLAHFSADARLIAAFQEDRDVHRETASRLFGRSFADVTAEERGVGKTINFATIYGQGATALAQILGIPRKDAQRYIQGYFETYAGVRSWLDETIAQAHRNGYVTTILGRRRFIPELRSHSPMDKQAGERIAANNVIQGSAADLCKLAMLKIARRLRGTRTRMLLQVHDELVFEVPREDVAEVKAMITEVMEHPMPLNVPLVVNIGVGPSWGDAH